jgi:hypothetical protein
VAVNNYAVQVARLPSILQPGSFILMAPIKTSPHCFFLSFFSTHFPRTRLYLKFDVLRAYHHLTAAFTPLFFSLLNPPRFVRLSGSSLLHLFYYPNHFAIVMRPSACQNNSALPV